jgi:hypothetical protein
MITKIKIVNVMLTGAALAMLAAAPALAQALPPGLGTANALSANALSANALAANALAANAQSANSAGALGRVVAVELPRR